MEKEYYIRKYKKATKPKFFIIKLTLEGIKGNIDYPMVRISVNDKNLYHNFIEGKKTLNLHVKDLNTMHTLAIEMTNKTFHDTTVDDNNKILLDKFVKISKLYIDEVNIRNYLFQGKQRPIYHYDGQGPDEVSGDHLFFPGEWKLQYSNPPRQFFAIWSGKPQMINSPQKRKIVNKYVEEIHNIIK